MKALGECRPLSPKLVSALDSFEDEKDFSFIETRLVSL